MYTPKFKEGDWIKRKKDGRTAQVLMLLKTCYSLRLTDDDGWWLDYDYQDNWELTDAPPKNKLEEVAKAYANDINSNECLYTYTDFTDAFKAGAKWQKEQDDKELSEKIASAYQLGLADKEKMMMKEAVEVVVTETCGIASVWIKTKQFKPGQKIPVIIVKEDEK